MSPEECRKVEFLLQADLDGALEAGDTAAMAAHLALCPDCQRKRSALGQLSARLRAELPYYDAPARLRLAVEAAAATGQHAAPPGRTALRQLWSFIAGRRMRWPVPFGAGAALAAAIVLAVVLPRGGDLTTSVIASHVHALQPGHLVDVISTDQHTVKPWFDGRLDFSPPVRNLEAKGFPLVGGRLDYLAGRPVAVLAYRRAQHIIDLYVWPSPGIIGVQSGQGEENGYNYLRWTQGGMMMWAVSDLNSQELDEFVANWRASP